MVQKGEKRGKYKKKKASVTFKFDYKSCRSASFVRRYEKFLTYCKEKNVVPHKWRLLQYFCLSLTNWKSDLNADDVVNWKQKTEYIAKKIQECHIVLIDKIVESGNEVAIGKLLEREQTHIFEKEEASEQGQTINIAVGNFTPPSNAKIETVEVANEAISSKL